MHSEKKRSGSMAEGGILLLCAVLMQSAAAQQAVTITYGLDIEIPDTKIELKWLEKETRDFYPSQKEYETEVETLLKSPPMCLETDTYCRTTKSIERGIKAGVVWQRGETLPSTMQRPHEDPRVVENWERQRRLQQGLQIIEELTTGGASGGSIESLRTSGTSMGGSY